MMVLQPVADRRVLGTYHPSALPLPASPSPGANHRGKVWKPSQGFHIGRVESRPALPGANHRGKVWKPSQGFHIGPLVCLLLLPLSAACSSPLDQKTEIPPTGSGEANDGGGFVAPDAPMASGGTALLLDGGGAGDTGGAVTTSRPTTGSKFDPAVLAIDASSAIDSDDAPSMGIVIFDRSGSMQSGWTTAETDNPDSAVTVSKWVAASRALIGSLTPVQDRVTIGAVMFPSDNNCAVAPLGDPVQLDFMPAREFIAEYVARSPENQPQGNTPLAAAFQVADQAIQNARVQGRVTGRFFVMVLTDGEPNCDSDMSLVVAIASSWLTQGIQTHVFGLPGSESAHMVLDSLAQAGGTQTIVVPGSSQQLESDMAAIY